MSQNPYTFNNRPLTSGMISEFFTLDLTKIPPLFGIRLITSTNQADQYKLGGKIGYQLAQSLKATIFADTHFYLNILFDTRIINVSK